MRILAVFGIFKNAKLFGYKYMYLGDTRYRYTRQVTKFAYMYIVRIFLEKISNSPQISMFDRNKNIVLFDSTLFL